MLVLDVAGIIRCRLGEPTVAALARRFAPGGICPSCGDRFGAAPLSVRAYHGDDQIITLIAYHASCAASAWLDIGSVAICYEGTWATAITSASLPAISTRIKRLCRVGTRAQELPVMLVHPSLEVARIRHIAAGEAVNADVEDFCQQGFIDPGPFSRARRLPDIGQAWTLCNGDHLLVCVVTGGRAWSAPVRHRALADLIAISRGTVVGVTCEQDPAALSSDPPVLEDAVASGEVLLGWAPLARQK